MPNHVHFFCRAEIGAKALSDFVGNWKSWTSRAINALDRPWSTPAATTLWQREFFDHVLRSNEAIQKSGITSEIILFVMDWYHRLTIGHMRARSRR